MYNEKLQTGGKKIPIAHIFTPGNAESYKVVDDARAYTIKDSGDRTEFSTGAVRDMREGKGRCDLMPLYVVSHILVGSSIDHDPVLQRIEDFRKSGNSEYLYNAIHEFITKRFNYTGMDTRFEVCVTSMLLEVAKHFEDGAKKYGENNWQKGIPVHCYIDSAVRHYLKWLRGDKDEPHDRAFVWNLMCCIWEVDYHEEGSND
jgi:hypothetical protein